MKAPYGSQYWRAANVRGNPWVAPAGAYGRLDADPGTGLGWQSSQLVIGILIGLAVVFLVTRR